MARPQTNARLIIARAGYSYEDMEMTDAGKAQIDRLIQKLKPLLTGRRVAVHYGFDINLQECGRMLRQALEGCASEVVGYGSSGYTPGPYPDINSKAAGEMIDEILEAHRKGLDDVVIFPHTSYIEPLARLYLALTQGYKYQDIHLPNPGEAILFENNTAAYLTQYDVRVISPFMTDLPGPQGHDLRKCVREFETAMFQGRTEDTKALLQRATELKAQVTIPA